MLRLQNLSKTANVLSYLVTETGQCLNRILDMELKIRLTKELTAEKLFLIRAGQILNFRGQY